MATAAQIEANRNNAQHSTGPKTESGKSVSAKNAFRHGLASGQLIAGWESREEYDALLAALVEEHQPATTTETLLVHQMAQHHWLAQRALFLQQQAIEYAEEPFGSWKKLRSLRPLPDHQRTRLSQSARGALQTEERAEETGNWVRFAKIRGGACGSGVQREFQAAIRAAHRTGPRPGGSVRPRATR